MSEQATLDEVKSVLPEPPKEPTKATYEAEMARLKAELEHAKKALKERETAHMGASRVAKTRCFCGSKMIAPPGEKDFKCERFLSNSEAREWNPATKKDDGRVTCHIWEYVGEEEFEVRINKRKKRGEPVPYELKTLPTYRLKGKPVTAGEPEDVFTVETV